MTNEKKIPQDRREKGERTVLTPFGIVKVSGDSENREIWMPKQDNLKDKKA